MTFLNNVKLNFNGKKQSLTLRINDLIFSFHLSGDGRLQINISCSIQKIIDITNTKHKNSLTEP